jgi:hypothetical protein
MKFHLISAISGLLVLMALQPAMAQSVNEGLEGGKESQGTVSSIDEQTIAIQTTDGTEVYNIDPELLTALKLQSGNTVVLDSTRLETGTITGIDRYTVKIDLDNGDRRSFVLDREGRGSLTFGDRVVLTPKDFPSRCQKLYLLENYELRAGDLRKVETYVATVKPPEPIAQPPVPPAPPIGGGTIEPPTVPGFW